MSRTSVTTLTGALYAISAALPATYDQTGYAALSYTAIGSAETVGNYGSKRAVTTFIPINGPVQKVKGSPDYGVLPLTYGDVPHDAGQVIVKASEASANHYSMQITYVDGEVHYLDVLCSSLEYQAAKAGDVKKVMATMNICLAPVVIIAP